MKVLILSITTGQGHHSAAKSISDAFSKHGIEYKTVDVYKQISKMLYDAVDKGYLLSTKITPRAYKAIYELLDDNKYPVSKIASQNLMNVLFAIQFEKFIEDYNPDAILCTHLYAAQIINELKRRDKLLNVPTIGIVTDYTIHPGWETVPHIEYINLASELLAQRAVIKGINPDRLRYFGIPIREAFGRKIPKTDACKKLDISPDKPTILLMAGSMGYGNMPEIISGIHNSGKEYQILAVCGNNKRLVKKLNEKNYGPDVKIYGFIDNVDIMMDAADCIITKPGGLSTSEAMAKQLPMILVNPIPGQEDRNLEFFLNNGVALAVTKTFTLEEALYFMFNSPNKLDIIRNQLKTLSKPDAADTLTDFIINLKK